MKKVLIFLASLGLVTANAGTMQTYSFLNNNVTSLMVSNNCGATNILSQVGIYGGHVWTNIIGNGSYYAYTNGVPFTAAVSNNYYAPGGILATQLTATLPGTLILDQKTNITSTWSYTGTLGVSARTNDTQNLFADVPLVLDQNLSFQPAVGSSSTNGQASISVTSQGDTVFTSGTAGGVSNNISLVFVPLWDGIHESTDTRDLLTLSFTNLVTAAISETSVPPFFQPQTFAFQLPAGKYIGCKTLRLQKIYATGGTNLVWIQAVGLNQWSP